MRWCVLLYGFLAYAVGFAGLLVFMLYLGNWPFFPWRIDEGEVHRVDEAIAVNVLLMLMFGLQHSVMARPWFKRALAKVIPRGAERSTYVLFSGLVLTALCTWWRPLPGLQWRIEQPVLAGVLLGVQVAGWALVVVASFTINHWELFGLQQVFYHFRGEAAPPLKFTERGVYRWIRHPIQTGLLIGMWCTPVMTTTHLVFAVAMTAYILLALRMEEHDLVAMLGPSYEDYRRRVPKLFPIRWRRGNSLGEGDAPAKP